MNLDRIEKKLREADFFLNKMREQERSAFGDREPFDFYLSAFLSAGMTIRYGFHSRQNRGRDTAVKAWHKRWEHALSAGERCFYDFMRADRSAEIHGGGSGRSVKTEEIALWGNTTYSDRSGTTTVFAPPRPLTPEKVGPDALIIKPAYYFTIAGNERRATDVCAEYLSLLSGMVEQFKADRAGRSDRRFDE